VKSVSEAAQRTPKAHGRLHRAFLLKLEVRSHPQLLCVIRGALEPLMTTLGFSPENCRAVIRAVDEAVSNIMRHSYQGRLNQPIEVYCSQIKGRENSDVKRGVEILLFDCGAAVDPTKLQARPLDEVRPGGLGLHIIRGSMDSVEYKRAGRLNRLRLVKYTGAKCCSDEAQEEKENPS
jgi:serine/threonine-protein kinase RsbW